jgi:hypothetical protein
MLLKKLKGRVAKAAGTFINVAQRMANVRYQKLEGKCKVSAKNGKMLKRPLQKLRGPLE